MSDASGATAQGRYHHGDLRRALLEVARGLLQEVGPDAVSLREVARRAGVSSRAPYRHFEGRDALMAALATEGFDELRAVLVAAAEAGAPDRRLRDQAIAYVGFALGRPALYRLMFSTRIEEADPALARSKAATKALLSARVEADAAAGADVAARARGCWALVHGMAVLLQDGLFAEGAGVGTDRLVRDVIDAML